MKEHAINKKSSNPTMPAAPAAQTFQDPVCGMSVAPGFEAGQHEYAGEIYYFCSTRCLEKFRAGPQTFITPKTSSPPSASPSAGSEGGYTCPMHPEVRSQEQDSCPKCGMGLERVTPLAGSKVEYTCPMHPQIVRAAPGACPICGMALEPRTITADAGENPELKDMRRRFWVGTALTVPVLIMAMSDFLPGRPLESWASPRAWAWIEMFLATPVVLWGGWPFFVRGWKSIVNRSLNMFTLIGLGVGVAYFYSVVATVFPHIFPLSFRGTGGEVAPYFEAASVITVLVLLGQVLELKARSQTGAAIRSLLDLAPKLARLIQEDCY